jgi:uncharacterized protein
MFMINGLRRSSWKIAPAIFYDSGLSIKAIIDSLTDKLESDTPKDIRVATIDYKPQNNKTDRIPDYYVNITSSWLVYPHELEGLSIKEIADNMSPEVANIVESCQQFYKK